MALICLAASLANAQSTKFGDTNLITADRLKAHLSLIADDLYEGRDTPSRGLDLTAMYIATQLKLWGATPGGDNGTYFQKIQLGRTVLDAKASSLTIDGEAIEIGVHFMPRNLEQAKISAEAVWIKSGYSNSKTNVDPFKGLNVKGKIVVTDGALPEGVSARDLFRSQDWKNPVESAMEKGALAVIYTSEQAGGAGWERMMSRFTSGGRFSPISGEDRKGIPSITLDKTTSETLTNSFLSAGDSFVAPKIELNLEVKQETATTQNVIAIVEGTDPQLKKEYVALGAHYDHVGIGQPNAEGDTIYNGADDDGSGTVALMEIAHALATGAKPKRSTIFIWHAGEEKGLWGSAYFVEHPTVPLSAIKSQVNIDMIGRSRKPGDVDPKNKDLSGPDEIYVIGPQIVGPRMTELVKTVNDNFGSLKLNHKYDLVDEPNRFFFRSDHVNYVRKGIPAVFLFSGVHDQYHQAGDEVSTIDFQKMEKVTRTLMAITWEIAMTNNLPTIQNDLPNIGG